VNRCRMRWTLMRGWIIPICEIRFLIAPNGNALTFGPEVWFCNLVLRFIFPSIKLEIGQSDSDWRRNWYQPPQWKAILLWQIHEQFIHTNGSNLRCTICYLWRPGYTMKGSRCSDKHDDTYRE
jgi:hypothetical protein